MAPIPRLAAAPLTIITALLGAWSGPNSSPPSDGSNATVWGTTYKGTASFLSLSPDSATPTTPNPSHFYYDNDTATFTGCNNKTYTSTDNVVLMNSLQFGDISSENSTCGNWVQIHNRGNGVDATYAEIVGICEDCDYGSVSVNLATLKSVDPDLPFDQMVFDKNSTLTIANLTDPANPLPATTPISPKDLLNISWQLSEPPKEPLPISKSTPTSSAHITTKSKAPEPTTTKSSPPPAKVKPPAPEPTTPPSSGGKKYSGRGTWYSDTSGQCEKSYSQSDMIVAVNEAQMGTNKNICGQKIRVSAKGSDAQVIVTIVDMCPSKYCNFGDLDLSQGAFKKFADLGVGVLDLEWSFV
ncbi:hypothetical protein BGX27_009141 [Mortierella sp. AM989]|nr:hypothetical protein BGX27_009141 [Mortierella sp. AM989]